MTKLEALRYLDENFGSHGALDREEAEKIAEPFGFKPVLWKEKANVTPKGLWVRGAKRGQVFERIGGFDFIAQIAAAEKVEYQSALGRGTEYRYAMAALQAKLAE